MPDSGGAVEDDDDDERGRFLQGDVDLALESNAQCRFPEEDWGKKACDLGSRCVDVPSGDVAGTDDE